MLKVRLRNRVLRIDDEKAEEYKKLGYTVTDLDGNVLYAPRDKDKEIAALKEEVADLRRQMKESSPGGGAVDIPAADTVESGATADEAPRKRRKSG